MSVWTGPYPATCINEDGERVPCCQSCGGPDVCPSCGNCEGTVQHGVACVPGFMEWYGRHRPWLAVAPHPVEPWLAAWYEHLGFSSAGRTS